MPFSGLRENRAKISARCYPAPIEIIRCQSIVRLELDWVTEGAVWVWWFRHSVKGEKGVKMRADGSPVEGRSLCSRREVYEAEDRQV